MSDNDQAPTKERQIVRRKFRGRLGWGKICSRCRTKRVKCDGLSPCVRCVKANCPCSLTVPLLMTPSLFRGNRAVYDHLAKIQTWTPNDPTRILMTGSVFPAAQINDTIFNALTCYAMVRRLPMSDALRFAVPPQAIEHYVESLKKPPDDIDLLLLVTWLYIEIEARLAHLENVENLYRSAFAIVHSTCSHPDFVKSSQICLCIRQLIEDMFTYPVNPASIPREHWESTMVFMLGAAAEKPDLEEEFLISFHVEIANLMYEMSWSFDVVFEERMKTWEKRYEGLSKEIKAAPRQSERAAYALVLLNFVFDIYKINWYSYSWRVRGLIEHSHHVLERTDYHVSEIERRGDESSFRTLHSLEASLIPIFTFVAYHNRERGMARRLIRTLEIYKKTIPYCSRIIDYINELVRTPFGQPTSQEIKAFGVNQQSFLHVWQYERLLPVFADP